MPLENHTAPDIALADARHQARIDLAAAHRLAVRDGFQVKQIVVSPHQALSLQSHNHRAEHWIILSGNARITVDDSVQDFGAGGYVFIPLGAIHRLENVTDDPVVMVEVQIGSYLGEDDIIRYSDRYARVEAV